MLREIRGIRSGSQLLINFIEVSSVPMDFLKVWLATPHFCSGFSFENQIHRLYHKEWSVASGRGVEWLKSTWFWAGLLWGLQAGRPLGRCWAPPMGLETLNHFFISWFSVQGV